MIKHKCPFTKNPGIVNTDEESKNAESAGIVNTDEESTNAESAEKVVENGKKEHCDKTTGLKGDI